MANLQLSFASALYDRMQPIYTGEVKPDGIDLNFIRIEQPRPIFDRMSGGEEFDVAEYSSSEYVQRYANKKCNFVAIPVFPSRCFRHAFIGINRKKGIAKPKDLEGKRIGVALYTMTAAIFIRGMLQHEYGVDFSKCTWVQGAINTAGAHGAPVVLPLLKPLKLEQGPHDKSLDDLIQEGAVDATMGTSMPESFRTNPDIGRLFPDFVELEKDYYKRTAGAALHDAVAAARHRRDPRAFRRRSVALWGRGEPADPGGAGHLSPGPAPDRLEADPGRAVRADLRPGMMPR